jgi:thiol:disulfide interchange protein
LGPRARAGFGTTAVVLLGAALFWMLPSMSTEAVARQAAPTAETGWQAWSPERAREAASAGRPVFVDFTAAWCVTCQFNKRTTLADARVLEDLERKGVLLLRADWTRRDPAITAELARLGRNGVPVYALYSPGVAGPRVLSEILSVRELRDAVAALP